MCPPRPCNVRKVRHIGRARGVSIVCRYHATDEHGFYCRMFVSGMFLWKTEPCSQKKGACQDRYVN